jgi:phosphate transport system permease protein
MAGPRGEETPVKSPPEPSNPFRETAAGARQRRLESRVRAFLAGLTMLLILPLVAIVVHLGIEAWPALRWSLLVESPRNGMRDGGLWPAFVGTLYLVGLSLVVATPVGVAAAVYLHEYARDSWLNRVIQMAVINLAGVPSIVHALFGLGAFVYGARLGYSVLAASLTLAVMTLPVIITSTREALAAVPSSFREACWNVGATRWQTLRAVVLPNAVPGILTGVILQVSRAAGETAPILFTGAVFFKAVAPGELFAYRLDEQCMALAMHLYTLSTQVPGVRPALPAATAVVLLGVVLLVNAAAIIVRTRSRSHRRW